MSHPSHRRRRRELALAAALAAGALAGAAPANAEPVKAGPALPDELAVLTAGGGTPTPGYLQADAIALHRLATGDGAYKGRITFPTAAAEGVVPLSKMTWPINSPLREHSLKRSVDGRLLTFTGVQAASGTNYQDTTKATAVHIAADGTRTDVPLGSNFIFLGSAATAAVTVDGTRDWVANINQLATVAPGDSAVTRVAAPFDSGAIASADIVDGSLYTTTTAGVSRLPGALPTTANPTGTVQRVIPLTDAVDSAFLDTDGVAGVDTAYVTRGARGVWKFALSGGAWAARGRVSGSFSYVAARALDGKVELYSTNVANTRVQKLVDTAQVGGELTSTGVETLAYAPAGRRYTGVAFAPGTGFPSDSTPYPATPPALYPSQTTVDTALQASPKASLTVDVTDPNTPASELTLTATSANATVLPNDRIAITGTGERRTVTFDPVAVGTSNVTLTVKAGDEQATATIPVKATAVAPDPSSHYYSGAVDLSASLDVGGDYFLGMSDEVNVVHLFKKGVSGGPITSWSQGFPGGETDFEGVTRFGDTVVWSGSHGNNRSGSARPERRFLAFQTITGSGETVDLDWRNSYTRLWTQWKAWDAANGHGLGANKLKFNTATVPGLIPNAPNGFNVEGLTMAPGSQTTAWFGMRAPTITGDDGIERALILPVTNIDKLTSDAVDAQLGAPILLDLGGRSIRDISKNANDQYLIEAGTGDTDDSLKNWALYTWDGNPAHNPQMVKELPTNESQIGAWEGIAELPTNLVAGSRVLLTADSGDTGLGKSYGQYVTLGEPIAAPAVVTGITATGKPGAVEVAWSAAERATRYFVSVKTAAGVHAVGSPRFATGTSTAFEGLTAGTEYTVNVRAENVATRTANGTAVKATPIQGARAATTTALQFEGLKFPGEAQTLIATLSDPAAKGTIRFFDGTSLLQDAVDRDLGPVGGGQLRFEFPVVDGKAKINLTGRLSAGLRNLRAEFTTANAENFLSSVSGTQTVFLDYKPRVPFAEVVSVTGDRVVGGMIAIKVKLHGYTPAELSPNRMTVEFNSRINGAANWTRLDGGEITAENPTGNFGYAGFNAEGEATFYTRALVAGKHRIGAWVPHTTSTFTSALTSEVPVTIAPAGSPAAEAPALKVPYVALTISGPRITNQAQTLTARLSDKTLAGTVQFFYSTGSAIGTPVPVVDGVATRTGTIPGNQNQVFARFEPTADRDTTASAISLAVPILRGPTAELPFGPATPTATTLAISGDRVAGAPLTANIDVKTDSTALYAARDINGSIELLSDGREIALVPVAGGKATARLTLPVGAHTLQARYVSSNELRSLSSASASQDVAVVVKTDVEAGPGGSVPATLALSLGAPATFGAFVPGVAKEYTAATTANVTSTAGDAALTVSEPGHLTNGAFALPQPLQVELTPAVWTGPVSNGAVDITFKQAIGANDALRTGAYSKTLTFTLSTTAP